MAYMVGAGGKLCISLAGRGHKTYQMVSRFLPHMALETLLQVATSLIKANRDSKLASSGITLDVILHFITIFFLISQMVFCCFNVQRIIKIQ